MQLGIDASNIRAGGGVTHLVELLRHARPCEHGITQVVVWAGQDTLKKIPVSPWLQPVHEPMLDRPLPVRLYWQALKLPQLAKQTCDVLFVPGGNWRGSFRPVVTMSRNMLPFERAEVRRYGASWIFLRLSLLRLSQTGSLRNADGVIFLNEYARSTIVQQVRKLRGRWTIIPHGINQCFCLPPRVQRPLSDYSLSRPFRLLYVSTVDLYKHQWHVVEAVARLRWEGIPLELDLVGSAYPPALRHLRKVIGRVDPQEEFVHYKGPIAYSEITCYYHRADGFVFASSCENMPNILLEAMASGLPIACSNRGPMPEVLSEGGVYFGPERPEEIARTLRSLIMDPGLREQCAQSAYRRAQEYSWESCARDTFDFIAQVANKVLTK